MCDASLMDIAGNPEASNVGCLGPPPSVVRRHLSSNARVTAPCALKYMGQNGISRKKSYHPLSCRRRSSFSTDA